MRHFITLIIAASISMAFLGCAEKTSVDDETIREETTEASLSAVIPSSAEIPSSAPASETSPETVTVTSETKVQAAEESMDYSVYDSAKHNAVTALSERLSEACDCVYVYRDFSDTFNHFTQKALMEGKGIGLIYDMDENCTDMPYAGDSCIKCHQFTEKGDWGGWMFLNGYLPEGESVPLLNDGSADGQGLDLSGVSELRFFARGEKGGEIVEFFTAGFGYDGEWGIRLVDYPDSAQKQSSGFIKLTDEWEEYVIPLSEADMSYTVCGFGYVLSGDVSGKAENVFYLDEIRFTGDFRRNAPVMLRSYDTDNVYIKNAAFSYDNALAAMAFISEGMEDEASKILDSLKYAVENDRDKPGRVRNAYAAGDISAFNGWDESARLPGWYDMNAVENGTWYEDRYQVGSNVGNTSYVALAMLQYDFIFGGERYLETAEKLMDWVIDNCSDKNPGFTAGFDGWAEGNPPLVYTFTYKSIEHNIDAYAAFKELYERTGSIRYKDAADSALTFVKNMYGEDDGFFYTGTMDDGVTENKGNRVLDAQVWAAMAMGDEFSPYEKSLLLVERMRTPEGGYPFCESNVNGGFWSEGTAYTALLYRLLGDDEKAALAFDALKRIQLKNGLFPAATVKELSTGFELFDGSPWVYSDDAHIAPTAWFIMALNGFNPYSF